MLAVASGCGTPLRPRARLWEGGVRWAFLFVLRGGRRPVEPNLRDVPQRHGGFLPQAPMSNYVNDMWPGSPLQSPAAAGGSSRLSSAARSRSRSSGSSRWSSGSSGSRPRRRSRSRSRSRRRQQRKYRRYSRSYSRSRSRSRSRRRYRERRYAAARRYYRSPSPSPARSRSRSRSRSRGRSYYRRAYAVTRGRRFYGFGRTVYPEDRGSGRGRSRSRSRSRSPTPFRLSEKDRMELLEIAKANAAKALGTTNFELPPSLRIVSSNGAKFEVSILGLPRQNLWKAAARKT